MEAEIGKRYRHYKNHKEYTVLHIGRLESDSHIECVIYRSEHKTEFGDNQIWIRPRDSFEGEVEQNGTIIPRFVRCDLPTVKQE